MRRLVWVFAGRTSLIVGFVVRWLNFHLKDDISPDSATAIFAFSFVVCIIPGILFKSILSDHDRNHD